MSIKELKKLTKEKKLGLNIKGTFDASGNCWLPCLGPACWNGCGSGTCWSGCTVAANRLG